LQSSARKVAHAGLKGLILCVTSFVFPTFNALKVVHHEYPPFAFSDMSVMPYSLRNILVGGPQMSEYEDVIRGPPNPNLLLPSMSCDSCGHLSSVPPQKQRHSGTVATDAEVAICLNYNDHLSNYCFQPVAIETIVVYGKSVASFLYGLAKKRICPVITGSDNDSTSTCPWLWSERCQHIGLWAI